MNKYIGLDAGSVSVKLAVIDSAGKVLHTEYVRHRGNPLKVALGMLEHAPPDCLLSLTGSAGKLIAQAFGIKPVNEVVALSYASKTLYPEVRTVIEMGGEDSKVLILHEGSVKEFSMNSVCAAGTGSFLDQQAERLNLSIEEFSEMALRSENPPHIAGRCSVFAKSDMIHLQQIATPVEDIVAGLCFAVVRNFKSAICKNMYLPGPISFQGGVAANSGVKRAFREILKTDELIIPEHFAIMPAIGSVLKDMEAGTASSYNIADLKEFIDSLKDEEEGYQPLCDDLDTFEKRHEVSYHIHRSPVGEKTRAYLGIDIGSISTNLVVMDEKERVLAKRYLMTAGRPIEAVKQGLGEIGAEIDSGVEICAVGTTGSGRYMIADFVGADIVKNEITAQAQAAVKIAPDVDTILEIGGQDSKFISIKDGVIVDFEMNKACAAGTGSFLEEQAEKLDISVKNDFADIAFQSGRPCSLGERCTVFMENSLLSKQQRGAPREDLVSGLSYSIVQNYINRVVGDRPIGKKVFFQGGVAFNKSVTAAFEKYLGKEIIVPPHHDVTGAIGMAIIAKEHMNGSGSGFKGFDLSKRDYQVKSFECKECDNLCEINRVKIDGEKVPLYYGSRCEKYDVKRAEKSSEDKADIPDLFAERQVLLEKTHNDHLVSFNEKRKRGNGKKVYRLGMPRVFFFHDFLPFWSTLLWELGFEVDLSSRTNRQVINKGLEHILAESCFPHKVAHGHIKDLLDKDVDAVFMPSFINFCADSEKQRSFACPYAQTMPYIAETAFENINIIKPVINYELGTEYLIKQIAASLKQFNITKNDVKAAMAKADRAQDDFRKAVKDRGMEILGNLPEKAVVIVGRAYNAFDPGINLEIPKKLAALGVLSIPMDFLPLEMVDISERWDNMYWRSGQNILKAAEVIRENPKLFALFIGNFSCGPDSFIQRYFTEAMTGKPYLHIEIDEHSANAGAITRCEAFLDSISGRENAPVGRPADMRMKYMSKNKDNKIVYLPRMSDHAFGVAAAFEACGISAEVMAEPDAESIKLGRQHVTGKECYPCTITTGDMVRKALSPGFDPDRSVFFMPSGAGPCRFGQYNVLHRIILNEIGFPNVPIYAPNQDESFYTDLGIVGNVFTKQAWRGIVAIDMLMKCLHETRPYEVNKGETDNVYNEYLDGIYNVLKKHDGNINGLMSEIRSSFASIKRTGGKKPLIGLIGEIFVRHNRFANEEIIRKIEALGGEVWLAPFEEWIRYINAMGLRKAAVRFKTNYFSKKHITDIANNVIAGYVQNREEHKLAGNFKGFLKTLKEPDSRTLMKYASPYLDDSFEGEAVLSIGKAVDYVNFGASGIISAMPFGCMPGTIVSAMLKGLKKDYTIPSLSVSYDGAEATCSDIQLEAFMHQATEYMVNADS